MPPQKILIVGSGVSGSILAFFLAKSGFEITIVERSKAGQKLGQGVEIEEPATQVVKAMGIMPNLQAIKTGEAGIRIVDEHDREHATFDVENSFSVTGSLEMMRGDLTEVFYKAADAWPNVTYHFETTVSSLRQTSDDKVIADLEHRVSKAPQTEEFDLVIGADGFRSRTRHMIMGSPEQLQCFRPVHAVIAYFSVPKQEHDWPYSKLCNFPGSRLVWLRPVGEKSDETSVYLLHAPSNDPELRRKAASGDREVQKAALAETFAGLGWEVPRVIEHMLKADNFYCEELAQVRMDCWSKGRVVLCGDSAWAPTPFRGGGNQLAIIGAWVLAQEIERDPSPAAFVRYEKRLRPFVEESQKIPLNGYAPRLAIPDSVWGVWVLRKVITFFLLVSKILALLPVTRFLPEGQGGFDLEMTEEDRKEMR